MRLGGRIGCTLHAVVADALRVVYSLNEVTYRLTVFLSKNVLRARGTDHTTRHHEINTA